MALRIGLVEKGAADSLSRKIKRLFLVGALAATIVGRMSPGAEKREGEETGVEGPDEVKTYIDGRWMSLWKGQAPSFAIKKMTKSVFARWRDLAYPAEMERWEGESVENREQRGREWSREVGRAEEKRERLEELGIQAPVEKKGLLKAHARCAWVDSDASW